MVLESIDRTDTPYLKDSVKIGYEAYQTSRLEAKTVFDMYHNRFYTQEQLNILATRGQPAETFNIVKLFTRLLLGYYSTVVNTVNALPVGPEDVVTSTVLNDIIGHVIRDNNFYEEGEKVKLSGLITGLMCSYVNVQPTGKTDEFGRPINKVILEYIPESEIILDPMSKREDYTDARFIHRYKWLSEEAVLKLFTKTQVEAMTDRYNFTDVEGADFETEYPTELTGYYKYYNNYLVIHSIVIDEKGDSWSIFWHDDIVLKKTKITHKEVKFPYRVTKTHTSDETEYYGIFRDVMDTQIAINQALIKLQLMVNTSKAFVEENAVDNIDDFTNAYNRVTAVIEVNNLSGIKIENMSQEVLDQYVIIDKGFDRIQRVLGINDSFLGMAFASDSGRKVKLQQNSSIIALRYLTGKIESFYRFLGWDIANLIKQYYTATQVLRIAENETGYRWTVINEPAQIWSGQMDQQGQPIMEYQYEEVLDPGTGEPLVDDDGNYIMAPIPVEETEIAFTNIDIEIVSTAYNDEDEKNQLMLETVLAGPTGQFLMQVNPAGYLKAAGLSIKSTKTKNSPEIAQIYAETAQMLGGNPQAQEEAKMMAGGQGGQNQNQGPLSQQLKLPQNTNEGV